VPVYEYEHVERKGRGCPARLELRHGISETVASCPTCGKPIRKVVARFSHPKNVLAASNLKEHGFTRLRRRDKGAYEAD
jgi:predicted nucleic acid-binding Zn ribbon protein